MAKKLIYGGTQPPIKYDRQKKAKKESTTKDRWPKTSDYFTDTEEGRQHAKLIASRVDKLLEGHEARYKRNNPSETHEAASSLARKFHGRDNVDSATAIIQEGYHSSLAVLGLLEELEVITDEDSEEVTPIEFDEEDNIIVASNPNGTQIYLVGEADLTDGDLEDLGLEEDEISKDLVEIGHIHAISYFADKHHLEGPKYQEKGASYRHEFGEEGGTLPSLYLNKLSNQLSIMGGSYKIEEEGIKN